METGTVPKRCEKFIKKNSMPVALSVMFPAAIVGMLIGLVVSLVMGFTSAGWDMDDFFILLLVLLLFVPFVFSTLFGMYWLIFRLYTVLYPYKTRHGARMMQQAGVTDHRQFQQVCAEINQDLAGGWQVEDVVIGSSWLLCDGLYRIDMLRGCYCYNSENSRRGWRLYLVNDRGVDITIKRKPDQLADIYQAMSSGLLPGLSFGETKEEHLALKQSLRRERKVVR